MAKKEINISNDGSKAVIRESIKGILNMKKETVKKIDGNQLRNIIRESVSSVLNEISFSTVANAYKESDDLGDGSYLKDCNISDLVDEFINLKLKYPNVPKYAKLQHMAEELKDAIDDLSNHWKERNSGIEDNFHKRGQKYSQEVADMAGIDGYDATKRPRLTDSDYDKIDNVSGKLNKNQRSAYEEYM